MREAVFYLNESPTTDSVRSYKSTQVYKWFVDANMILLSFNDSTDVHHVDHEVLSNIDEYWTYN